MSVNSLCNQIYFITKIEIRSLYAVKYDLKYHGLFNQKVGLSMHRLSDDM